MTFCIVILVPVLLYLVRKNHHNQYLNHGKSFVLFAIGITLFNLSKSASYDNLIDHLNDDKDGDVNSEYVAYEMLGLSHFIIPILIIIFKR